MQISNKIKRNSMHKSYKCDTLHTEMQRIYK